MKSPMLAVVLLALTLLSPALAQAQQSSETRELTGRLGRATAVLSLTSTMRGDGGWRVTGEYLLVPSFHRRFLEGERSPQLGVTTLREGATPIFFGRAPTGTLQGTWRDGRFSGVRLAPGGQERESFEFTEEFPGMEDYSARVQCEAGDEPRYGSSLAYAIEAGKLRAGSFEWRAKVAPSGHTCTLGAHTALAQAEFGGGLHFKSGKCAVTLREIGDFVRITAENCAAFCGSQAYFEPLLVDRRGACMLQHPRAR